MEQQEITPINVLDCAPLGRRFGGAQHSFDFEQGGDA